MLPITQEVAIFKKTRERLLVEFPDIDEQTLADTLEGMTTLQDMLSAVIRSELDDRAMAEALKSRIADMSSRFDRLDARIRKKRELVLNVMSEAELTKLTEADFTASLRIGRAPLIVSDETKVPDAYWQPQHPKLDRHALLRDLRLNKSIPGAALGNAPKILAVRTK